MHHYKSSTCAPGLDKFPLHLSQHFMISLDVSSFSSQSKGRGRSLLNKASLLGFPSIPWPLGSCPQLSPLFPPSPLLTFCWLLFPPARPRAPSSIYKHLHVSPCFSAQLCLRPSPGRLLRVGLSLPDTRTCLCTASCLLLYPVPLFFLKVCISFQCTKCVLYYNVYRLTPS